MSARVLVIGDEAIHAWEMATGLGFEELCVQAAASAHDAIERLDEESFDLAVVDLMMPGTNAIQLARSIRQRHPETRVVLTGAYPLSERQLFKSDCGALGFVPKPFAFSDLAPYLRAQCTGSSPFGGAAA